MLSDQAQRIQRELSLISEVLHKKRVPKQVADQAADGLVAAIA
ncbi:MAG: hypothetical protein ACKVG4_03155 [Longimicrobiales bacterium]